MKKTLSLLLLISLLLGFALGTAQAEPALSEDGRFPVETVKIGFVNYDTSAEQVLAIQSYFEYLQTAFNFEVIWSEALNSAAAEFAFIEQCAAAGCKAIIGYYNEGKSESVKLAADLGMYYFGGAVNADIYEPEKNNPFYVGGYISGAEQDENYLAGYAVGKALVDAGSKKVIVMSGGKDFGVEFFVKRYNGIMDALNEGGAEVVYEVPGWPGTEAFAAHQTAALQTEADGLAGTLTCMMWLQPMQNAGKMGQIKVAGIETVSEGLVGLMQGGIYVGAFSEIPDMFGLSIPMILNAVTGYGEQQRNPDGSAGRVKVLNWVITNPEDMAYFAKLLSGEGDERVFSIEDLKTVMGAYNPDFTLDDMSALYSAVTADEIRARHAQ
jgi:ABC-type sugar transport system substrate-binding protein